MAAPRILALDIGTSSVRASFYDARLTRRKVVQIKYRWDASSEGRVGMSADRLLRLVEDAVDGLMADSPRRVDAVAIAAFWHSLLGVDGAGRAVTPLLPWSDTRAASDAEALRRRWPEKALHARTGCRVHESYWPARLRWFRRNEPRVFSKVRRWVSFPEFLESRWLGRSGVSRSQASGTGLFDQNKGDWDSEMLTRCRIDRTLVNPVIHGSSDGDLARRLRRRWPALAGANWVPAFGDGALNNVGAGCTQAGDAALTIGTSGALRLTWDPHGHHPNVPMTLWRYRLDGRRVVVGGALSNGGNLIAWMRGLLGLQSSLALYRAIGRVEADSHGLTLLPFVAGARSPDYLPGARGLIDGLHPATTPTELLRAGMEAVAYRFAVVMAELAKVHPVRRIVASGGALERSDVWTGILADVMGRPIEVSAEAELTSRGAAVMALEALGVGDIALPKVRAVIEPDRGRHAIYRKARDRQQVLFERIYS